jgi:hypothetical protein
MTIGQTLNALMKRASHVGARRFGGAAVFTTGVIGAVSVGGAAVAVTDTTATQFEGAPDSLYLQKRWGLIIVSRCSALLAATAAATKMSQRNVRLWYSVTTTKWQTGVYRLL